MRTLTTKLALLVLPLALASLTAFTPEQTASALQIRQIPAHSGNYRVRSSRTIDRVVIHTIEGSESSCIGWFRNPAARVSAHYVVSHAGRVTQMVADKNVAWHCGNWNDRAIGIENEGFAGQNRWTDVQYRTLAELTAMICNRYGIPKDRAHIVGHKEVPGATHGDPGPNFDWTRFMALVRGGSTTSAPPSTSRDRTHIVRSGETLSGIATSYNTTPNAIAQANGILNLGMIFPGQVLKIPGATVTTPGVSSGTLAAVEVTTATLNVRDGVWGSVIGQVRAGQRFIASRSQSGWYRIDWRGREGWVSGDYVRRVQATAVVVTASALNVRSGPGVGNSAVGMLANDQAVVRLGQSGDWLQVQFDHRAAWVHSSYVRTQSVQ